MEKNRPMIELLQILLNEVTSRYTFTGMCVIIICHLKEKLSSYEMDNLHNYIYRRKPETPMYSGSYWWPVGEREPRIEFLKQLISELKTKQNEFQKI